MASADEETLYDALYPHPSENMEQSLKRSGKIYKKILDYIEETKIQYRKRLEDLFLCISACHYAYHSQKTGVRIELVFTRVEWLMRTYDDEKRHKQLVSEILKVVKFED
jgi:hypothetical protein